VLHFFASQRMCPIPLFFDHFLTPAFSLCDVEKMASFESEQVPTDAYGVGSAFMRGSFDFTADVVKLDGAPMSKTGRQFRDNERLVPRALMTS